MKKWTILWAVLFITIMAFGLAGAQTAPIIIKVGMPTV